MFIRHFDDKLVRSPDGGDSGSSGATPEPQTFPIEYVRELRRENESWRKKAGAHETDATTAKAAADAAKAEATAAIAAAKAEATAQATQAVTDAQTRADARVIRAELRAAAVKAGMVDIDGLKLIDASTLKITADGEVEGVDALIAAAKVAKPYLFGSANTSNTQTPPPPKAPATKAALEMTDAEFEAALRAKTWRNK